MAYSHGWLVTGLRIKRLQLDVCQKTRKFYKEQNTCQPFGGYLELGRTRPKKPKEAS